MDMAEKQGPYEFEPAWRNSSENQILSFPFRPLTVDHLRKWVSLRGREAVQKT